MNLEEQLKALKEQLATIVSPDALATIQRQIDGWRASGISESALKTGDRAPEFTLRNIDGEPVNSMMLLGKGPMVLHFFRGKW